MSGALQGVKVLEIGSYVTGPYAGMLLGDLGAEVIKVENKPYGDPFRGWGRTVLNPTFCSLNRNKNHPIRLHLKTAQSFPTAAQRVSALDLESSVEAAPHPQCRLTCVPTSTY